MTDPGAPEGGGSSEQPHDPRVDRQRVLVGFLHSGAFGVLGLAVLTLSLPDRASEVAGKALIGLLVGVPVLRVAWLAIRWLRKRDDRFAATGLLLLVVMTIGLLVTS